MDLRAEWRVFVATGCAVACVHAARPVASYRALELGGSAVAVGLIAGAFAILPVLTSVPLGRAMDRHGSRPFFLSGLAVLVLAAGASGMWASVMALGAAQALLGLGQVAMALGSQTIVGTRPVGPDRDRAFARLAVATSFGQLLGPALAGSMLDRAWGIALLPTTRAFLAAGIVGAVGFALASPSFGISRSLEADEEVQRPRSSIASIARSPGMSQALGTSIAVVTGIDLLIVYLPVIGESRGISPGVVGVLLSIRAAGGLASRVCLPLLLRRCQRNDILVAALSFAGAAMVGVAFTSSVAGLALFIAVIGFALGLGAPVTIAWVTDQAPNRERGTALALRMLGNRASQIVLPVVAGGSAVALGPGSVFVFLASSLVVSSVWVHWARATRM